MQIIPVTSIGKAEGPAEHNRARPAGPATALIECGIGKTRICGLVDVDWRSRGFTYLTAVLAVTTRTRAVHSNGDVERIKSRTAGIAASVRNRPDDCPRRCRRLVLDNSRSLGVCHGFRLSRDRTCCAGVH